MANKTVSPEHEAIAREIISKNEYTKFVAHKKLMLAWLMQDDSNLFLFFIHQSCCLNIMDVMALDWLGLEAFNNKVHPLFLAGKLYPHEVLYMTKNGMLIQQKVASAD
jgi:hypothetical protein